MTLKEEKIKFPIKDIIIICLILVAALISAIVITINNAPNISTAVINSIDIDNGDQKINWNRYNVVDIELENTYEITKAGIYHFTGELENGFINIKVTKEEPVKIILNNVTIKNSQGPAIVCYEADDLVIELLGENYIEDGESYSSSFDADIKGAIYSKADLTFEGDGTLNLSANFEDGIVGKDDLKINSGLFNIKAKDDAIRGKDSVYVIDGEFNIESMADAIKTTNETDNGKGYILIENGDFNINSGSAKGIKATNSIIIKGGEYKIISYDDAIHSNNYVGIADSTITINASDDAIHADRELVIDNSNINVEKGYEGLEAQKITIESGNINIVSIDDGINTGGGTDSSAKNRPGAGMFDVDEECVLTINDGYIYISASGDGLDSNGNIYINGGKTIVDGPTNNGNGALDASGVITVNGGEVIAVGYSGMAGTIDDSSTVYSVSIYLKNIQTKDTLMEIIDDENKIIASHIPTKNFNHIIIGTNKFQLGKTYTIYLNGEEYEKFEITKKSTIIGNYAKPIMQRK